MSLERQLFRRQVPKWIRRYTMRIGFHQRGQVFADEIDDWITSSEENKGKPGSLQDRYWVYHYMLNDDDESEFAKGQSTIGEGK